MTSCAVFGCSNDSKQGKDHTYHKFPSDKTLKSKWSSAMTRLPKVAVIRWPL